LPALAEEGKWDSTMSASTFIRLHSTFWSPPIRCYRLKLIPDSEHRRGRESLLRIVAMLVKLALGLETR
jgi:hypothetical protein